jgi:putative copper export protein
MGERVAAFCSWLELTPLSRQLQTVEWVIPAIQTVHILAIAAVMGSMLFFNLRLLGLSGTELPLDRVSRRFVPVILSAVVLLLATGVLMIAAEPARSLLNPVFQLKMALLLCALIVLWATARPLRHRPDYWSETRARGRVVRALASVSVGLWVAIVFAGRWIAYVRIH